MAEVKKTFSSTEHLNPEAIAAYVDGELTTAASRRAAQHVGECEECCAEVNAQRGASARLRECDDVDVRAPEVLRRRLTLMCPDGAPEEADAGPSRVVERLETVLRSLKPGGLRE